MTKVQFLSADEAAALIDDDAVIGLTGGGGGLVSPAPRVVSVYRRSVF